MTTTAPDDAVTLELGRTFSDGRSEVFLRRGDEVLDADTLSVASSRSRQAFINRCKQKLPGIAPEDLDSLEPSLVELASRAALERATPTEVMPRSREDLVAERDAHADSLLQDTPGDIRDAATALLHHPDLIHSVQSDIGGLGIAGEQQLRLTTYLVGTSRLLDDPLAAIAQGPSSTGKSHVTNGTGELMPPESVMRATDLTPNALYYVSEGALVHSLVLGGERAYGKDDQIAEAKRSLREMLSSKVLHKVVPVHSESGPPRTEIITRYGPIAYIESTTQAKLLDEDANRCLLLATDESPEQTRRILTQAAIVAARGRPPADRIIHVHRAAQRMLRRVDVRVPFAEALSGLMPDHRPEARRGIGQLISLIRAVALLHQRQRHPAGESLEHRAVIEADLRDYATARELLIGPLGRLLGGDLSPAIAHFGRRVTQRWRGQKFTAAQAAAADATIKVPEVARRYLGALAMFGVVEVVEGGRGGKPNLYEVVGDVPEAGALWLPTVAALQDAGVDREPVPTGPTGGGLVRQIKDATGAPLATSDSAEVLRPSNPVCLGAPGGQPLADGDDCSASDQGWRTSRIEAHEPDQLPIVAPPEADSEGDSTLLGPDHQERRDAGDWEAGDICCAATDHGAAS